MESEQPAGLSAAEAAARLAEHGPNELPAPPPRSAWVSLLAQLQNPLVYVLLFALAVDLTAWALEGAQGVPLESCAIALILVLNAGLGVLQEGKAERALERLRSLATPHAWVLRGGELVEVPARELVPGDRVRLEPGDRVPADARVLPPGGLLLDESLLTGESLPVHREPGEELASGTLLVRGTAQLEVLRTGTHSAMGRLGGLLAEIQTVKTPLERRLDRFAGQVLRVVAVAAVLLTVGGVGLEGLGRLGEVFLFAVALAVAAVPEGLPAVMTLALALGVERMARRKAVVRKLGAVEALGSVTVIATDKTGTLTENQLQVRELLAPDPARALATMACASEADPTAEVGDPLDLALLRHVRAAGQDPLALRGERVSSREFDSEAKFMRVTLREGEAAVGHLKGAPEVLIARCALGEPERAAALADAERLACAGSKVVALARGAGEAETELEFLGLVALWDPPREAAPAALARARAAGIDVLMITGDHPGTAQAIASQVGIPADEVLTGAELDALSDDALAGRLETTKVCARVTPEHKLRLVELLQARGEVVAMTGDGVNDAPALKKADVGIAMGRGSDVAREASELILLDDDFTTVVDAIEEGRSIYENIQKFLRFLFATNLSELIVVLCGTIGSVWLALREQGGALLLPLTAAQILWINLVSDSVPALSLALDRNPDVMRAPPRDPQAPLLDRAGLGFVLGVGLALALVPLALLVLVPSWGYPREVTRTVAFHALVISQLLVAFPSRRLEGRPSPNRAVSAAVLATIALQLAVANLPAVQGFLGLTALPLELYPALLVAAIVSWGAGAALVWLHAPREASA